MPRAVVHDYVKGALRLADPTGTAVKHSTSAHLSDLGAVGSDLGVFLVDSVNVNSKIAGTPTWFETALTHH